VASHSERAAHGLSFEELRARCLVRYPRAEETLRRVLREETAWGRVDFHPATGRYHLNGGLGSDVCEALLKLTASAAIME
jgi:hypothetical protein